MVGVHTSSGDSARPSSARLRPDPPEIEIRRPRAEVAANACDPENAPEWYENIESAEWLTPPPLGVGSQVKFAARFMGRRLVYTYEIRELVAGERLVMSTDEGAFPMETTYLG